MATTTDGAPSASEKVVLEHVESAAEPLAIDTIAQEHMRVPIIGLSPLLVHRFSEKAKKQMLDAAQNKQTPKEPKDPKAEYDAAFYRLADDIAKRVGTEYGFPAEGLKKATVGAARFYGKAVTMTFVRQVVFIDGERADDGRGLVPLYGEVDLVEGPLNGEVVRVGRGTDLRYRPKFWPWHAVLDVFYFPNVITRGSVLSLVDAGGRAVGIGDWRPEKDGTFGTYCIDQEIDLEVVREPLAPKALRTKDA